MSEKDFLKPWVALGGLLTVMVGCGPLVGVQPAPGPSAGPPEVEAERTPPPPAAEREVSPSRPMEPPPEPEVEAESEGALRDPILDSGFVRSPEMDGRIQRWIESFRGREASVFAKTLGEMGRYRDLVDEELRESGLPPSLLSLPIVESWYNPRAVSRVGAAGLWQFMPPTARGMGLQVDGLIDERKDPYRSTPLALAYLAELNERFGSWILALAAYNGGPGRMARILRRRAPGVEGHDGLFLDILSDLPRETRDFVPRFIAAAMIARDPGAYGFGEVTPEEPLAFDRIEVPDATSLDVVARAAQVDQAVLEELNPQLLRGLTPAGVATGLRVPPGTGARFDEAYAQIPPEERVTFLDHSVISGETFTHIARRYGVSVSDLRAANPRIQPRRMQIGQRVVVPKAPSARERLSRGQTSTAEEPGDRLLVYRVQSGDTLTGIALRHRVGLTDLLRWNDLSRDTTIHPGDQVRIYISGG